MTLADEWIQVAIYKTPRPKSRGWVIFSTDCLGVLSGTALVLAALSVGMVPTLRYRFWRYELRAEELALTRGIWTRVHTIVPLRRIQHLDVSQDVIERNFDLGRLIVHTAGTQSSNVELPGLAFEEAERLRREVKNSIREYAV